MLNNIFKILKRLFQFNQKYRKMFPVVILEQSKYFTTETFP